MYTETELKSLETLHIMWWKPFTLFQQTAQDKQKVDDMFKALDANADGTVDFTEFVTLVAALTAMLESGL